MTDSRSFVIKRGKIDMQLQHSEVAETRLGSSPSNGVKRTIVSHASLQDFSPNDPRRYSQIILSELATPRIGNAICSQIDNVLRTMPLGLSRPSFGREYLARHHRRSRVDGGLSAVVRMRVTNLALHLSGYDSDRYRELTGQAPPHDGFLGLPVFDSDFGPSKQYYFDNAVAAAAARKITRLSTRPGVVPGSVDDAARCMWDFAVLVYKGPLLAHPDCNFEPNVIRPAVKAASEVDHAVFVEALAAAVCERESDPYVKAPWHSLGATSFVEGYLDSATVDEPAYARLLDKGLTQLVEFGALGVTLPPEVLSPRQRDRIRELGLSKQ